MKESKVYAVVISYNPNVELLDAEYKSIVYQVDTIIYVDNNSVNRDDVSEWCFGKKNAILICMDNNEGIGAAQNAGIKKALQDGASHVVIFDQDTVVNEGFVEALMSAENKAIEDGINVGITGPIYFAHDDGFPYPILTIENGRYKTVAPTDFEHYYTVSHLIASGELIRREVLEKCGLMREDYFIEYVDYEYCFRICKRGYKCIVTNKASMQHQMGDRQIMIRGRKVGIYSPFRRYFTCRNSLLIQRENVYPVVFKRRYLILSLGKFVISLLYGPKRFSQLRYCCKGYWDGILRRSGKCSILSN